MPLHPDDLETQIDALLASEGRERKRLLKDLLPHLGFEHLERIAILVRDPSPRVSSRIVALLIRGGRRDLLEAHVDGLPAGRVAWLRAQGGRHRGRTEEPPVDTARDPAEG
jgi:hypothetical protein